LNRATLQLEKRALTGPLRLLPCKTRPTPSGRGFLLPGLILLGVSALGAQQREGDEAWSQGHYEAARTAYMKVLATNPQSGHANLRVGIMLSWAGKTDSALIFLARARAAQPNDTDVRLAQAQAMAWNKQYPAALLRYDSILSAQPDLRAALLGRARTLSWAGRLDEAQSVYGRLIDRDSTDRDALLGQAQVHGWKGELQSAERQYRRILGLNGRDADARVGLGYVYLWQGRSAAAGKQAEYALAIDPGHKTARELHNAVQANTRTVIEISANWSSDSDENTNFWQTLTASLPLNDRLGIFASINALEASDPVRDATRVGGETGITLTAGALQLTGAAGARRLNPEIAEARTSATYRGQLRYRPSSALGLGIGYSRTPFDEIASLIERELDLELLEGGFDVRPLSGLTLFASGGVLWLSDGNHRNSVSAGATQKVLRRFFVGAFGRTLSYERRGLGYFSPDRFTVLEGTAGYNLEQGSWIGNLSGGLGAQRVGKDGSAQTEWHLEGRVGQRWGGGNRVEVFGLVTNSAVSSTTGAFRYGSAGLLVRLGL
jgi:tetratricopeptide (TPR) repeat protein